MSLLKKYVFNNLSWKLLSLFLAAALWFYCMNITVYMDATTTFSVPLKVVNDEQFAADNMLLRNKTYLQSVSVRLRVKGERSDIDALQRDRSIQERFEPYIDLGLIELRYAKDLGSPTQTTVFLKKPAGFEVIEQSPSTVSVVLEKHANARRDVTVYTEGKPADGYMELPKELNLEQVTVSGPQTQVSMATEVRVTVNVKGQTAAAPVSVKPQAYDFDGNPVSDVIITPAELSVAVPIYKLAKIPISKPEYKGEPPEGYAVTGIDWNPKYAEVMGSEDAVAELREIALWPIEGVDEMTAPTTVPSYDLRSYLPINIQIVNGAQQEIVVEVFVEKIIEKTATLLRDKMTAEGTGEIISDSVKFSVSGVESLIGAFTDESVSAKVNLEGLEPGPQFVTPVITLPQGITISGAPPEIAVMIPGGETEDQ
jgi:YbbR domain-containing protein